LTYLIGDAFVPAKKTIRNAHASRYKEKKNTALLCTAFLRQILTDFFSPASLILWQM